MLSVWMLFAWVSSVRMLAVWMEGSGRFCFLSRRSLAFGFVALRFILIPLVSTEGGPGRSWGFCGAALGASVRGPGLPLGPLRAVLGLS